VSETFDGKADETFWHIFTQGGGPEAAQRNGQVELSIPGDATPSSNEGQISGNYELRCLYPDDFDAQVDYKLLKWPSGNGVLTSPVARLGPRSSPFNYTFPQISRLSLKNGEELYQSYLYGSDLTFHSDDREGRLRLARRDGVVTTYYWQRQRWVKVASERLRGAALIGRLDVAVAFDNFELFASRADCS
jgi:hypothetical protein